jgi:hypothetical protein
MRLAAVGEGVSGVAGVAAAVLAAHIGDDGVGPLDLHLERGDQRIVGSHDDAVRFALRPEADRVLRCQLPRLSPASIANKRRGRN